MKAHKSSSNRFPNSLKIKFSFNKLFVSHVAAHVHTWILAIEILIIILVTCLRITPKTQRWMETLKLAIPCGETHTYVEGLNGVVSFTPNG